MVSDRGSIGRNRLWVQVVWLVLLAGLFSAVQTTQQPVASQSEAEYEFGKAIHFSLLAQGSSPITAVTLFFSSADSPATMTIPIALEPALEVRAAHTVELTQLRLAPFTTITYWWQVTDADGTVLDVPAQTLAYEDDRFEWRQLSTETLIVRWTSDDPAVGQAALDIVQNSLPSQMALVPVDLPDPLRIYIYPSAADLQSSLRLAGRDWVGGHTNPALGVILVTAANSSTAAADLRRSIPHELMHLLLYQATGAAYTTLPRWFDEGLAAMMEAGPDPNEAVILDEAVAAGTTIPFEELCAAFPPDGRQAALAYAQSGSLLRYIQAEYGNGRLRQMVQAFADGANCETVITRALGISLTRLNQNWLQSLDPQPTLGRFWQSSAVWLLLLGAGFGLTILFLWPVKRGD